jgi:hypothetical protein
MITHNQILTFIHEYDFPIYDLIIPYKEDILKQFENKFNPNQGNSTLYINPELQNQIVPKFVTLIKENYKVSKPIKEIKLWTYIQNNYFFRSFLHNHIFTSTLNAVFYIDIPKIGGELKFAYENQTHTIFPQKNKLYVFPYWLSHKPLPQKDQEQRICFNLEYFCRKRPIHKKTQVIW